MNVLTAFPIRYSLPVILLLFNGAIAIISLERDYSQEAGEVEEEQMEAIRQDMTRLQGSVEGLYRKEEMEAIQQELSMLGSQKNLEFILLMDERNRILHANRFRMIGRMGDEILPRIASEKPIQIAGHLEQARREMRAIVLVSKSRQSVLSYFPVHLVPGNDEMGPARSGIIFAQYDLSSLKAAGLYEVQREVFQRSLAWIGLTGLLWLALHLFLTRRVYRLVTFARRFSLGDFKARTGMTENDELGRIGKALDRMASKVESDQVSLRESEENFRAMAENASDGILVSSGKDPTFRYVNQKMLIMLGYSQEEFSQLRPMDLVPHSERDRILDAYRKRMKDEEVLQPYQFILLGKEGREVPVEVAGAKTTWQGEPAVLAIIRDIRERQRAAKDLQESEEKFRQAQKMEAIGRLAGGVAHDFNNLLTAIMGYSELMMERLGPSHPLRKMAEEILMTGDRAAALTAQLLTFSRRQVFQPRVVDVNGVVVSASKMLRRVIGEDIDMVTHLRQASAWVKSDPHQLEQILMNLSVNARDAMPQGGQLTLLTTHVDLNDSSGSHHTEKEDGRYVMFSVADTGGGMGPETLQHLFEPFFTTKEPGKGTGLGLSTVYGIVQQSDGKIQVKSELGKGTTISIYLPRVPEPLGELEKQVLPLEPLRHPKTILVVEDEETVRSLVCAILQMKGYQVLGARNGREALDLIERQNGPIHLMITDVVMPRMSGVELAQSLMTRRPEIQILFVSGYPDDEVLRQGISQDSVAFLPKPFTPDSLLRKIQGILRETV